MIRICPERDGRCPNGMKCPFVNDQYSCKKGWEGNQVIDPYFISSRIKRPIFQTVRT